MKLWAETINWWLLVRARNASSEGWKGSVACTGFHVKHCNLHIKHYLYWKGGHSHLPLLLQYTVDGDSKSTWIYLRGNTSGGNNRPWLVDSLWNSWFRFENTLANSSFFFCRTVASTLPVLVLNLCLKEAYCFYEGFRGRWSSKTVWNNDWFKEWKSLFGGA